MFNLGMSTGATTRRRARCGAMPIALRFDSRYVDCEIHSETANCIETGQRRRSNEMSCATDEYSSLGNLPYSIPPYSTVGWDR